MKIISNFKDYYDHQVSIFGIDPLVNYERVCWQRAVGNRWQRQGLYKPGHLSFNGPERHNQFFFDLIAFCGTIYAVGMYRGRAYYGDDINDIPPFYNEMSCSSLDKNRYEYSRHLRKWHSAKTDLNMIENCPAMLVGEHQGKLYPFVKNPRLSDYAFQKAVSAEYAWNLLTDFFLKKPEIQNNQTDKEKVLSHGFDIKHSFRNTK